MDDSINQKSEDPSCVGGIAEQAMHYTMDLMKLEDKPSDALPRVITELTKTALGNPAAAIPRIEAFERLVLESGQQDNEVVFPVHFLYFLACGKLVSEKYARLASNLMERFSLCVKERYLNIS